MDSNISSFSLDEAEPAIDLASDDPLRWTNGTSSSTASEVSAVVILGLTLTASGALGHRWRDADMNR